MVRAEGGGRVGSRRLVNNAGDRTVPDDCGNPPRWQWLKSGYDGTWGHDDRGLGREWWIGRRRETSWKQGDDNDFEVGGDGT